MDEKTCIKLVEYLGNGLAREMYVETPIKPSTVYAAAIKDMAVALGQAVPYFDWKRLIRNIEHEAIRAHNEAEKAKKEK